MVINGKNILLGNNCCNYYFFGCAHIIQIYTHVTNDMQFRASEIVGDFMEEILGKDLMPWLDEEKMEPVL